MSDEEITMVVSYELTDSSSSPEFFTKCALLAFDNPLDDFIEDILDSNPTKFMHYCSFSKDGGYADGIATLDGFRDSSL